MSVPVNETPEFKQPTFSPTSVAPTVEPTNEELYKITVQPLGRDWLKVAFVAILIALAVGSGVVAWLGFTPSEVASASSQQQGQQKPTCRYTVTLDTKGPDNDTRTRCLTQAEYDVLLAKAEAQYEASLKRGKPVYGEWLTSHKLSNKVETVKARDHAARKYICESDEAGYSDGTLYAATQLDGDEGTVIVSVGDTLVPIDGYNPQLVACDNSVPKVNPNPPQAPKPSVQPKDPHRDPAPMGNANTGGGRIDAP